MLLSQQEMSLGDKIISTKIPLEEYTRFKYYCDSMGETLNASLKRMILSEIDDPRPSRIVGKSVFEYNKSKDNFAWKVVMDNGTSFNIDLNLPASSIEHLLQSLKKATNKRKFFLNTKKNGSVSFPTKLLGRKK